METRVRQRNGRVGESVTATRPASAPLTSSRTGRRPVRRTMTEHDFDTVYRDHRDELIRALTLSLRDHALAAEAVDEAFTRALHRWNVVGSFPRPQAWVYRTAKNWSTSRFRRRSRDQRYAHLVGDHSTTFDITVDPELGRALEELPSEQRHVLVLRYYLDWSIAMIAEALDISPGTVKSRTARALNELHRLLGDRT